MVIIIELRLNLGIRGLTLSRDPDLPNFAGNKTLDQRFGANLKNLFL